MRFVSYNIQYGKGRDGRFDLPRIADAVRDADVIALQEVERYWLRSGLVDQAAELAALLPEHHWVYGPGLDMDASVRDRAGRLESRRRQFGNMLLARGPDPLLAMLPPPQARDGDPVQPPARRPGGRDRDRGPARCASTRSTSPTWPTPRARPRSTRSSTSTGGRPPRAGRGAARTRRRPGPRTGPPPPMPRDAILMGDFNLEPVLPALRPDRGPPLPGVRADERDRRVRGRLGGVGPRRAGRRDVPRPPRRPADRLLLPQHAAPPAPPVVLDRRGRGRLRPPAGLDRARSLTPPRGLQWRLAAPRVIK